MFLQVSTSIIFIIPVLNNKIVSIVYGVIHIILLMSYMLASVIQPGYVKRSRRHRFQGLLNRLDPAYIWPEWSVIRTPRSRHWSICDKCVDRFDHHWPYINNWVGYRNHPYFLIFLTSASVMLIYLIIMTAFSFKKEWKNSLWKFMQFEHWQVIQLIVSVIIIFFWTLFLIPVLLLNYVHIWNFSVGKTTHERFSENKIDAPSLIGSLHTSNKESSMIKTLVSSNLIVDNVQENKFNYIPDHNNLVSH